MGRGCWCADCKMKDWIGLGCLLASKLMYYYIYSLYFGCMARWI